MPTYAQFFRCAKDGSFTETLGSFAWIRIDGRLSHANTNELARETCVKRGYAGYQILQGENLRQAQATTLIRKV